MIYYNKFNIKELYLFYFLQIKNYFYYTFPVIYARNIEKNKKINKIIWKRMEGMQTGIYFETNMEMNRSSIK